MPARLDGPQRRLDPEWGELTQGLGGYRRIDPQSAERDAAPSAVIEVGAAAVVTNAKAFGAAVGHVQAAATVATPQ
jgi:hypothetical protein